MCWYCRYLFSLSAGEEGGLASQTANSDPSTVCTVPAVSHDENQEHFDGFQSTAEFLDELQSSAELKGCEHSEGDSTPDCESTAFSRISCVAEKSEEVRQSVFGVQNLPASVSSSELGPHQMGGSLAGTVRFSDMLHSETDPAHPDGFSRLRLKSKPVDPVPSDGPPACQKVRKVSYQSIVEVSKVRVSVFLSISDRALLRRFGSQETARKNFHRVGDSRLEVSTSVSRVDGHPLKLSSNLFDRALLRRFPDAASSLSSSSGTQHIENSFLSGSTTVVPSLPGEDLPLLSRLLFLVRSKLRIPFSLLLRQLFLLTLARSRRILQRREKYLLGKGTRRKQVFVSRPETVFRRNRNKLALPVASSLKLQSRLFLLRVFLLPQF